MRLLIATGALWLAVSGAYAQTPAKPGEAAGSQQPGCQQAQPSPAETSGQAQPQGKTGATATTSGGGSATSPQGDTPPGMQHKSGTGVPGTGANAGPC